MHTTYTITATMMHSKSKIRATLLPPSACGRNGAAPLTRGGKPALALQMFVYMVQHRSEMASHKLVAWLKKPRGI